MLSYDESLKILKSTNALLEGHFVLSSGLHSSQYIQCAKLLSKPQEAQLLCSSLAEKILKTFKKIDLVLSPAIGGIVVGYEIGRQLGVESIFAERVNKQLILRRDFSIKPNTKVLIVEDVITTGKSALECSDLIKINNGTLLGYSCIIDRTTEISLIKSNIISQIKFNIKTYKEDDLPDELKKIEATKPGSRDLSK